MGSLRLELLDLQQWNSISYSLNTYEYEITVDYCYYCTS